MLNNEFKHIIQSPWIGTILKLHSPEKGFLVEIGVGHTTTPQSRKSNFSIVELQESNTAELLNFGWSGIYIDPISEFCHEASLLHYDKLDRLKIINVGASDITESCVLYGEETFIPNKKIKYNDPFLGTPYKYPGRLVECLPTSAILKKESCPELIDFMSIDVEGYEEKVIKGIDFKIHKPKILFIETTRISKDRISKIIPSYYNVMQTDGFNTCWMRV